jgi:hypothetical protein
LIAFAGGEAHDVGHGEALFRIAKLGDQFLLQCAIGLHLLHEIFECFATHENLLRTVRWNADDRRHTM